MSEDLRRELAQAMGCRPATELDNGQQWCDTHGGDWPLCKIGPLLPVVTAYAERQARERAAEELRKFSGGLDPIEVALGGAHYVREELHRSAHSLNPTEDPGRC